MLKSVSECVCVTVSVMCVCVCVCSGVHVSVLAHLRSGAGVPGPTGREDPQEGAGQNR